MDAELQELVRAVQKNAKYRQIAPQLVARIGAAELAKGRKFKEAVKTTRNKLHQVGGAYQRSEPAYGTWLETLKQAAGEPEAFKAACRAVMANHASTYERLPLLDGFYQTIFAKLPPIQSVMDVACGLNPLAIPWMPLAEDAQYFACDIYADMVAFLQDYFDLLPVRGRAQTCDVIASPPVRRVDLALVLKTIPCLEQVDKLAGVRLLDALNARYLLVSFPAKSLGGRSKGMVENYEAHFLELAAGRPWQIEKLAFENELVFFIQPEE